MFLLLTLGLGAGLFLYLHFRKNIRDGTCTGCSFQGKENCSCQQAKR